MRLIDQLLGGIQKTAFAAVPADAAVAAAPVASPSSVLDAGLLNSAAGDTGAGYVTTSDNGLISAIGGYITVAMGLLGVGFLILAIYAGILWMTARGEPKDVKKAKDILTTAVVGLIITVSAYSLTKFVIWNALMSSLGSTT